ncbi:hypothetical protein Tco_1211798 [Tanacetum coccineum]
MEECHKMLTNQIDWTNPEGDQVMIDINRPLLLSGPPGYVIALSISKMKAARYHEFGLELLVSKHMWIDDVCTYDISASYGISHWWFNRQKFYIVRHTSKSSHKIVRTHMRILSVVIKKAYSRYGYDNLKEITLRRANHQEYTFAEKDFKNLYPNDFEDLNLLLLQGHLNHLPGSDILVFPVSNNERKIMRFNEIYKFSDGMLTNIMEALDYRVKEYKVNRLNPDSRLEGSSRIWNALLVDGFAILTTDFFRERNDLFIPLIRTGKLGDSDVHTLEDPTLILEIQSRIFFLRLNLPDHRSVLTGSGGSSKDGDGDTLFQWSLFHNRMSMPIHMSPAQDGKRPKVDDQRLDLADDLKEAPDHISSTITSHKTKITTSIKITLRVGEERIVFTSIKPASSLIKRVYMLSLRERMELDLEAGLMRETLVLNRLLDPFLEDYIELNDLNEPFELRRNQGDDLMPTIKEGEVIEEFRTRDDKLDVGIDDYPSYCDYDKKIHIYCAHNLKFSCMIGFEFTHANFFPLLYVNVMSKKFHNSIMKDKMVYKGNNVVGALMNVLIFVGTFSVVTDFAVLENIDAYRDEGMGDVIFGEPFLREVGIKIKRFEGIITIYNGDDEVTYQMARSHLRFKHHTNEQCNKIPPLLKVRKEDEMNGISHAYQKLKGLYK